MCIFLDIAWVPWILLSSSRNGQLLLMEFAISLSRPMSFSETADNIKINKYYLSIFTIKFQQLKCLKSISGLWNFKNLKHESPKYCSKNLKQIKVPAGQGPLHFYFTKVSWSIFLNIGRKIIITYLFKNTFYKHMILRVISFVHCTWI